MLSIYLLSLFFSVSLSPFKLYVTAEIEANHKIVLLKGNPEISGFEVEKTYNLVKKNEVFFFEGQITEPNLFFIEIINEDKQRVYRSKPFLLTANEQTCVVSKVNNTYTTKISNRIMAPIYTSSYFKNALKFSEKTDWLYSFSDSVMCIGNSERKDSLLNVIEQIKNVYEDNKLSLKFELHEDTSLKNNAFTLWMIYNDIYENGYNEYHQYFYNWLSDELKNSAYGIRLASLLLKSDKIKLGQKFPAYEYYNLRTETFSTIPINASYTFIDFWFSGCGKCISQFPQYMEIFENTDRDILNIISVSTDYTSSLKYLQEHRKKYNFKWEEFLDENGVNALKLGYQYFPKNVLLDSNGVVLSKNINPVYLKNFVKNNARH